jgi:phosphoribosylanthranilate isomerase
VQHTKVKICGITNLPDALAAVAAGADALGFMFYDQSPRRISPQDAAEIIRCLPPFVAKVGVFVNATEEVVRQTAATCGLDTLQLHGDETPDFCQRFALKTVKAFRIRDADSLRSLSAYATAAWLLDTYVPNQSGGTGARFDWSLAVKAQRMGRPIILAGGLNPENVA